MHVHFENEVAVRLNVYIEISKKLMDIQEAWYIIYKKQQ